MLKTILIYCWAPFANLLWYVWTIVMAVLSLTLWPFDRDGRMQHACARWWCRLVAWTIFARIRVHGVEHVKPGQPYVYMANHSSLVDTPALFAYLPYPFWIMAKRGLFWVPFMGWHLWTAGHFPVDRKDPRRTALSIRRVIEEVKRGKSLAVFPEGTRTRDGQLQEFKAGSFKIAVKAGVPIVPVSIRGAFQLLPPRRSRRRPAASTRSSASRLTPLSADRDSSDLMEETRAAIQKGLRADSMTS